MGELITRHAESPALAMADLTLYPMLQRDEGIGLFHVRTVNGGRNEVEIWCHDTLEPFKNFFFCGYQVVMSKDRISDWTVTLCLLPRSLLTGQLRNAMLAFSTQGGLWLNKPEAIRMTFTG